MKDERSFRNEGATLLKGLQPSDTFDENTWIKSLEYFGNWDCIKF